MRKELNATYTGPALQVNRPAPTQDQIRARAYEIYLRRNGGPDDAHSDWRQAEAELSAPAGDSLDLSHR